MEFKPVVPMGGSAGLRFIERTFERQLEAFERSPAIKREADHFVSQAGEATTAEKLVADRRLLRVALGAFGLEDEVDKRAFVRRVLEEGTLDPAALANRLADPAWRKFSATLGYGDFGGFLGRESVRRGVAEQFRLRQFERAVGEVDINLRLALHFRREIADIAGANLPGRTGWFRVLGSKPLMRVIEGAYGLPSGFGNIDIDRQADMLAERTRALFGGASPAVFGTAANVDTVLHRFLATVPPGGPTSPGTRGAVALYLLQSGGLGPAARANLFASSL